MLQNKTSQSLLGGTAAIIAAVFAMAVVVVDGMLTGAGAHQQKNAITIVLFNEQSGNLEVMHKLYLHDAEHAAQEIWGFTDLTKDKARRKEFADYVRGRFLLLDEAGAAIKLTPVGEEVDGEFLWVYHEAPAPEGAAKLTVDDRILRDFWTDQANLVNVEKPGFRGSLSFIGEDGAKVIVLPGPEKVAEKADHSHDGPTPDEHSHDGGKPHRH